MWGNRLGWTISACIVLLVGAMLVFVSRAGSTTAPTAYSADVRNFQPLQWPIPPAQAIPQTKDCDAGPLYRQAIDAYLANRALYDDFAVVGTLKSAKLDQLQAIDLLLEASGCGRMALFAPRPEEIINYDHEKPALDALQTLGRVCIDRLALLNQRAGQPAEAMRYAEAGFVLGQHLVRERITAAELELGLELTGKSTTLLAKLSADAGDTDRAAALRAFDAKRIEFSRTQIEPTLRFVRSIDPKIVGTRTGDVFELAKRSNERMWRVEAILALGRVRFFAGTGGTAGNQRVAARYVREIAETESDPAIRAAALAARDLTVEQYRAQ